VHGRPAYQALVVLVGDGRSDGIVSMAFACDPSSDSAVQFDSTSRDHAVAYVVYSSYSPSMCVYARDDTDYILYS